MTLEARKIAFVQEFLKLENEEVLNDLESLLHHKELFEDQERFKPMSMEEYEARIDQALDDSKKGRLTKATDLLEQVKKWT
jgi:hypothetical protein